MKVRTILVPTDFSEDAGEALSTAEKLAKIFDAKVAVLHAYHVDVAIASPIAGGYSIPPGFYEELRSSAALQVEKIAEQLGAEGVDAIGVVSQEPAAHAIVAEAKRLPADLIVIGTRGRTGIKHVVLGSVAERVVRTAPCPVLTVKAAS